MRGQECEEGRGARGGERGREGWFLLDFDSSFTILTKMGLLDKARKFLQHPPKEGTPPSL